MKIASGNNKQWTKIPQNHSQNLDPKQHQYHRPISNWRPKQQNSSNRNPSAPANTLQSRPQPNNSRSAQKPCAKREWKASAHRHRRCKAPKPKIEKKQWSHLQIDFENETLTLVPGDPCRNEGKEKEERNRTTGNGFFFGREREIRGREK